MAATHDNISPDLPWFRRFRRRPDGAACDARRQRRDPDPRRRLGRLFRPLARAHPVQPRAGRRISPVQDQREIYRLVEEARKALGAGGG